MTQPIIPNKLYHGSTLEQFLGHWQAGRIRAFSRHHLDAEGNYLGTWLSDSFRYVVDNKHGIEYSDEVLIEAGLLGRKITEYKMKTGIVIELSGVPEPDKLVPHLLPNQLFYFGEIPTSYIAKVHVDQRHDKQWEARDIERIVIAGVARERISVYNPFMLQRESEDFVLKREKEQTIFRKR